MKRIQLVAKYPSPSSSFGGGSFPRGAGIVIYELPHALARWHMLRWLMLDTCAIHHVGMGMEEDMLE